MKWLIRTADDGEDGGRTLSRAMSVTAATVSEAAGSGHLEMVKFLFDQCNQGCKCDALVNAATHNHEDVVRWLLGHRCSECDAGNPIQPRGGRTAISQRTLHLMRAMLVAAQRGHAAIVRFLLESPDADASDVLSRVAVLYAARNGHLEVVKWAVQTFRRGDSDGGALSSALAAALHSAIQGRQFAVIRWIRMQSGELARVHPTGEMLDVAMASAAEHADFRMLEWVNERHTASPQLVQRLCASAARIGHLEVVQWFSMQYESAEATAVSTSATADAAWGRIKCINAASGNNRRSLHKWLSWSRDSVGPI